MNSTGWSMAAEEEAPASAAADFVILRLLWRLDHVREVQSRALEERQGITSRQRTVLRLIGRYPGISPGRISRTLHLHPSGLTSLLKPLLVRGLVLRTPDPRDQRRHRLGLSHDGMDLDVPLEESLESALRRAISGASLQDLQGTREVLERLIDDIERR